ncbi:MAG: TonB-dependent receptor, partial [Acidobacteria bacterium]|nr:TonB-dependent receptor [Acidobacteriota bacterium]
LLISANLPLWGQEVGGELNGVVKDATGAVIPGATVTITNKATGRVFSTRSGPDGVYIGRDLEPGRYSLRFEATGFSPTEVADAILLVGRRLKLDATLQVAPVAEAVTVIETAPLLDLTSTMVSHNVNAEEFSRLPKARGYESLFLLSPSVNSGDVGGGFQVNGASGAENQFFVDGVSTNSLIDGRLRQGAIFEFMEEVQVKTGGIEAQYGGALGGVMSGVTKTGGNAFHGDVHYYFFGNGISAVPPNRLLLDPVTEASVSFVQDEKQVNNRHEFGGSLGGYFIKNKLWFFAGASPRWTRRENEYFFGAAKEADTIKQKRLDQNLFGKISFDPISRIRTNFTWLNTTTALTGRLPSYNWGPNGSTLTQTAAQPNKALGFFQPQSSYTGKVDITLSPKSILSVTAGRYWDNFKTTGLPSVSSVEYGISAFDLPANLLAEIPEAQRQAINFTTTPRQLNTFWDVATRTFINADYAVRWSLRGDHDIRAGAGTQKNVSNVNETYPGGGYVSVRWNRSFSSLVPGSPCAAPNPPCRGRYGYYEVNDRGLRGSAGANITHLYLQDNWRIHPRLSLNLGLRTEKETIPSFRRDIQENAIRFGFEDKLAPRLGFAYDVRGDGNLKVSFSWGRFFDWTKYYLSREAYGGAVWKVRYRALDTPNAFSLSGTNTPGADLWNPALADSFRDRRVPSFGDLIDPDIKPMSIYAINATVEYQLSSHLVFRGSYVRSALRRTIEDMGALVGGDEVYIHGNPGEGIAKVAPVSGLTPPFPMPRPKRTYDAMELSVTRRLANRWFANASYVLSRLQGNYAGLASSDEILPPSTGFGFSTSQQQGGGVFRPGGNLNRDFDIDELMWDSHGKLDVVGPLATDRTHVFKFYGSYTFPFGTEVGGFWYIGSGTPLSTRVVTANHTEVFVEGRGDLGRTDVLSQTDLMVAHEVNVAEGKKLRFEFNMLNLFNQKTPRLHYYYLNFGAAPFRDSAAINLSRVDLAKGYDYRALLAQTPDGRQGKALDPRFGKDDLFNDGFQGRFGIKFIF